MNWFEDIKKNTFMKVRLENGQEFEFVFEEVVNGIVKGKLNNGKIKKFKEDKIEDLEEIENTSQISELLTINVIEKESSNKDIYNISNSFLYKIDNNILTPIDFKGKEEFKNLNENNANLYSQLIALYDSYIYAKKINELDIKYDRTKRILNKLNNLLKEFDYEEIDKFLAYILQEVDTSYLEYFKKKPADFYCYKNDIYYFYKRNNKSGFILVECLFKDFYLDEEVENEWFYGVKNITNFNSIKILEYQYEVWDKLSIKHKNLLEESINYIANKNKINVTGSVGEKIKKLKEYIIPNEDYKLQQKIIKNFENNFKINKKNIDNSFGFNHFAESLISSFKNEDSFKNDFLDPNGTIKVYFQDKKFGFIEDSKGLKYYFSIHNIIDDELKDKLENSTKIKKNIEVCFSIGVNYRGNIAKSIHLSKTVKEILQYVKKLKKEKNLLITKDLLEQILSQYPNNLEAKYLFNEIERERINKQTYQSYNYGYYRKAKDAKDRKDYDTAIKYYKLAYENNEKLESTIKDLAVTYYENGEIEESRKFILENESKLSKTSTTYNFLENLYYSIGDYEKSIKYLDKLLKINTNNNKHIILLGKKASCYIKLNQLDLAKKILKEILSIQQDNAYAKKLLEQIESGNKVEEIYIYSFGGGFSKFIENTLNEYEEYKGVRSVIKENKNFSEETLKEIREIIKTAGKARAEERAEYLLTEAKLLQLIKPNEESLLKNTLAKYCNAMALSHINKNSFPEVIKFFYLESFSLEEEWRNLARQLYNYIVKIINKEDIDFSIELDEIVEFSLPKIIKQALKNNKKIFINEIIDIMMTNHNLINEIIKVLKQENMNNYFIEYFDKQIDNIDNLFKNLIDKRKRKHDDWFSKINSLLKVDGIENLNIQLQAVLKDLKKDWLSHLDGHRLKRIEGDITEDLNNYLRQKTFDDKERTKNYLITKINELIDDIKKYPTKFSYEGYKPLLEHLEKIIQQSFKEILKSSIPEIELKVLGDFVVDKNDVLIQLVVRNSQNSSPISNIKISIIENDDLKFPQKLIESFELLRGGNEKIFKLNLKVSNRVIENKAADVIFKISYKIVVTDENTEKEFKLPIRLYKSEEFEKIENVYAPVAEGGPVKDESMFFGRDEYIANIIDSLTTSNTKSIIIYGQKRSGKSTVLYHLKKELEKKENAFCIDFSMGEIIDDISGNFVGFYYKILSKIEEKLEELEFDGFETIPFEKPSIEKLQQAPAIIFDESIKNFYKQFKNNDFWKNKKLIILIDEFTYIYTSIIKNKLSENFMKTWKAFIEKNIFSAVLVGQDVTPKFKAMFPNEFGVTEDKRLTYLSKEDAKKLIEKPIWDKKRDSSRYLGNAVDKIINYTACNPYYLQMFCSRVVDYMNRKKAINVTEADVEEVFYSFIEGSESLTEDKFDNLLTAGDADINAFNVEDVKHILKQIAKESKLSGFCSYDKLFFEDTNLLNNILEDLLKREVISQRDNTYKIKVEMFEQWLLKH